METTDEILKRLYYDPKIGLGGIDKLYRSAKKVDSTITQRDVKEFIAKQKVSQILKPRIIKNNYPLTANLPFQRIQFDLLDINDYNPNKNGGFHFIFVCIDVFSRVALAIPQKNKTDKECLRSFQEVYKEIDNQGFHIERADSDNESGFKSKIFSKFCLEHKIVQHLNEPSDHKALGVIDRFCRTLRNLIVRYQEAYQTQKFILHLQDLIDNYNNSVHRTLGQSPLEAIAFGGINNYISSQTEKASRAGYNKEKFSVGDRVRVFKKKKLFEKGGNTFSKTVYTIEEVGSGENLGKYFVEGIQRGYRKSELMKVDSVESIPAEEEKFGVSGSLEEKKEEQKVEKRITRRIAKEGVERKEKSTDVELLQRATRQDRKQRDVGPYLRS